MVLGFQNVGEVIGPSLRALVRKSKPSNSTFLQLPTDKKAVENNPNFRYGKKNIHGVQECLLTACVVIDV